MDNKELIALASAEHFVGDLPGPDDPYKKAVEVLELGLDRYVIQWIILSHVVRVQVLEYHGNPPDDKPEPFVSGSIKWDGCSDLTFGDDGFFHWCQANDVTRHCKVIEYIYNEAAKILDNGHGECGYAECELKIGVP